MEKPDIAIEEVAEFERFLKSVGFKRVEGMVYGYLVLTKDPVTSDGIGKALSLSQGAVSQALNRINQWGAIESRYDSDLRAKVHQATPDSMEIVSNIFRKREYEAINRFKHATKRALEACERMGEKKDSPRIVRLNSIILTCELAESVIKFIVTLSDLGDRGRYAKIVRALPKAFDLLLHGTSSAFQMAMKVKNQLTSKIGGERWL